MMGGDGGCVLSGGISWLQESGVHPVVQGPVLFSPIAQLEGGILAGPVLLGNHRGSYAKSIDLLTGWGKSSQGSLCHSLYLCLCRDPSWKHPTATI